MAEAMLSRWPTLLALVALAGPITVVALFGHEAELFGPVVVTTAGIYLMAYAWGRPRTAWLALAVLSTVVSLCYVLPVDAGISMSVVVLLLWLWGVGRRRYTDGALFSLQTAGMVGFGAVTLTCAVVGARGGMVLAGFGFLAHALWDAYHFRTNRVVHRSYAEFCGVFDVVLGPVLIVAAFVSG
jgi:hypothetical protein